VRIIIYLGDGLVSAVYRDADTTDDYAVVVDRDSLCCHPEFLTTVTGNDSRPCFAYITGVELEPLPADCEIRRLLDEWDRKSGAKEEVAP
jgi:hypothetical protein